MDEINEDFNHWSKNLPEEINFWYRVIAGIPPTETNIARAKRWRKLAVEGPTNVMDYLHPYIRKDRVNRIIDIGCGPHTWIGSRNEDFEVETVAVDPLAEAYDKIWNEFKITPAIKNIMGVAERLHEYNLGLFDITFCLNALDHSFNPIKAINSMLKITNKNGVVYIKGSINEGKNQNYQGLHQWNFLPDLDNSDVLLWNKKTKISLKERYESLAKIEVGLDGQRFFMVMHHSN